MEKMLHCCLPICLLLSGLGWADETSGGVSVLHREEANPPSRPPSSLWPDGMGNGLRTDAHELGASVGLAIGTRTFGGRQRHHLVLGHIDYARLRTSVFQLPGGLRGSLDGRLEWQGAAQYAPDNAYVVGFTPVLRFNIATGSRWMPFVDAGAGLSLTDIRGPDLSTMFQFNLQGGFGCDYFLRDNLALTLQYRFLHLSNACIELPNNGVNANIVTIGLSRYF